ncbi:MAG: putative cardiolipin synthase YwiE, partial [Pseudomonadota bacterium]
MRQETPVALSGVLDRPVGWLSEVLLIDGVEYFSALLHEISLAKKTIFIETYILESGQNTSQILDALVCAASRGVRVCLLVDGVGSSNWISETLASLRIHPFEVRVFHPLPWQAFPQLRRLRLSIFSKLFDLMGIANRRDHRKMVLIDDQVAFVG